MVQKLAQRWSARSFADQVRVRRVPAELICASPTIVLSPAIFVMRWNVTDHTGTGAARQAERGATAKTTG